MLKTQANEINFNVLFLYIGNCRHYLSKSFSYFRYKISYFPDNFGGKTTYLILVSCFYN